MIALPPESIQIWDCFRCKNFPCCCFTLGLYEVVTPGWGNRLPAICVSWSLHGMLKNATLAPVRWSHSPPRLWESIQLPISNSSPVGIAFDIKLILHWAYCPLDFYFKESFIAFLLFFILCLRNEEQGEQLRGQTQIPQIHPPRSPTARQTTEHPRAGNHTVVNVMYILHILPQKIKSKKMHRTTFSFWKCAVYNKVAKSAISIKFSIL